MMNRAADPSAWIRLAVQDFERQDLDAAEVKALDLLNADPQHVEAWTLLGLILRARGRFDDAVRVFHSLTLKQPASAEHWQNLGGILRDARRFDEALVAFEQAVALAPPRAGTLYNVGLVQMERLDLVAAHAVLAEAVRLEPNDAWMRSAYAQCCSDLGRFEDAAAALKDWPSLANLTPTNVAEMAHLLLTTGAPELAQPAIERLRAQPPTEARAAITLANVLERTNRLEEARAALDRARETTGYNPSDPDRLLAEGVLAQRLDRHEEARELLGRALEQPLDHVHRHNILFPLAQSLDALGEYDAAFATLRAAHESQVDYLRQALGRSPSEESTLMALTRGDVELEDRSTWDDSAAPSAAESPIFVVGFPRSGTTLLEQTLDAHPALAAIDERPYLGLALEQAVSFGIAYPAELGRLTAGQLEEIRNRYWKRVAGRVRLAPGQRLVDKNPFNMLRLPLIRRLFPHARTVLIVRHPCDALVSCFSQNFRAPELALLCRDLGALADAYRRSFEFWNQQLPLLGAATVELHYERFVANLAEEARRLIDFLELPWNDALLSPASHARTKAYISTPSYTQVIEPVSSKAVGRWRRYEKHLASVIPVLAPYLEHWGYDH
jgi:tetratricopeptide (TPR) repeat protein